MSKEDDYIHVNACTPEMIREHEKRITETEQSVANAHDRMTNLQSFTETMTEMNINVKVIAEQLKSVLSTLTKHETAIDGIEKAMVSRLDIDASMAAIRVRLKQVEVERLEEKATTASTKLSEYKAMQTYLTKVLLGAVVLVVGSLIVFAVVILTGMANAGHLPPL